MTETTNMDEVARFCARNGVSEIVFRACYAAGPLAVRALMSNFYVMVEAEPPMPANASAPKAEPKPVPAPKPAAPTGMEAWPEYRVSAILTAPEAAGRPAAAAHLAHHSNVSVEVARRMLAELPREPIGAYAPTAPDTGEALVQADPCGAFPPAASDRSRDVWADALGRLNEAEARPGAVTSAQILAAGKA